MEKVLQSGRVGYVKPSPYNNTVFVGNWFEDRSKFVKEKHRHITIYMQDFDRKPNSGLDPDIMWDRRFKGQGCGSRLLFDHDGLNYEKNFSTLQDLTYNHLPKRWGAEPVKKHWRFRMQTWEPEQDCANNYGNITDYGLATYMKQLWEKEQLDPRVTAKTNYQDHYVAPNPEAYKFKKFAVPIPNSSIMYQGNLDTINLKLRNIPMNSAPPNEDLVAIPIEPACDPLNWTCPDRQPNLPRRCIPQ